MKKTFLVIYLCLYTSIVYGGVDVTKAVIHHSDSPDWSSKKIGEMQIRDKKFREIGYHFVIRKNGDIEVGRLLSKTGAHAKFPINRNSYVGICLTGYNEFSKNQVDSLYRLLNILGTREIYRHHNECPGKGLDVEKIQSNLKLYYKNVKYEHKGKATFYRDRKTANGTNMWLHPFTKTCATWFYPIGIKLKVTNTANNKSVIVYVNDRGPNEYKMIQKGRIIDLSPSAFKNIANLNKGEIEVIINKIGE
jgi:rare lipoprotein A